MLATTRRGHSNSRTVGGRDVKGEGERALGCASFRSHMAAERSTAWARGSEDGGGISVGRQAVVALSWLVLWMIQSALRSRPRPAPCLCWPCMSLWWPVVRLQSASTRPRPVGPCRTAWRVSIRETERFKSSQIPPHEHTHGTLLHVLTGNPSHVLTGRSACPSAPWCVWLRYRTLELSHRASCVLRGRHPLSALPSSGDIRHPLSSATVERGPPRTSQPQSQPGRCSHRPPPIRVAGPDVATGTAAVDVATSSDSQCARRRTSAP